MLNKSQQTGITFIELVISLAIALFVISGIIALFTTSVIHNRKTIEFAHLNKVLIMALNTLSKDIHRAGYWGQADTSNSNPFMVTGSTDITINAANNCILFTYDTDNNGSLPSISSSIDDERYGYRLQSSAIQSRPAGADFSCAAPSTAWTDLTNPNTITITQFTIALNSGTVDIDGTGPTLTVRSVTVTISAELTTDPSLSTTLSKEIKVYNDKYNP